MRFMVALLCSISAIGCSERASDGATYTLYRTSAMMGNARIHVASFDSSDGESYNNENCNLAADLFNAQPEIKTKFWCEKGGFRP